MSDDTPVKTDADVAHFFRALGRANDERMPMPRTVDVYPERSSVMLRFGDGQTGAIDAWAQMIGARVVHGGHTFDEPKGPWHEYGTRPGGADGSWRGWRIDLWCSVNEPAPAVES